MRVLIVNNGKREPVNTINLCYKYQSEVSIILPEEIKNVSQHNFDFTILTGSSGVSAVYRQEELRPLFLYIKNTTLPILGICYGAQIINLAFGGTLADRGNDFKLKGFYQLNGHLKNSFIKDEEKFLVYKGHRWVIDSLGYGLHSVSGSSAGVEAFVHKDKPIVGFQFHPEKYLEETDGEILFKRFWETYVRREKSSH